MNQIHLLLIVGFVSLLAVGCPDGPSAADFKEQLAASQAAAEQALAERELLVDEAREHAAETSRLWRVVCLLAVAAILLLFLGAALGSSARKDADQEPRSHDPKPPATR